MPAKQWAIAQPYTGAAFEGRKGATSLSSEEKNVHVRLQSLEGMRNPVADHPFEGVTLSEKKPTAQSGLHGGIKGTPTSESGLDLPYQNRRDQETSLQKVQGGGFQQNTGGEGIIASFQERDC